MEVPTATPPSYRDAFDTLLPPLIDPGSEVIPSDMNCAVLVDCSGSAHNLLVQTDKGLISSFDLFGSFATDIGAIMGSECKQGIDFVPFASRYQQYCDLQAAKVQEVYSMAEEVGLFNQLGGGTDLYEPLAWAFDDLIRRVKQTPSGKLSAVRSVILVVTDGLPTGGLESLPTIQDLCVRKFQILHSLNCPVNALAVRFLTSRPDGISAAWSETQGQSLEKWQQAASQAEDYYKELSQLIATDPKVTYGFAGHDTLRDVAQRGTLRYLAQLFAGPDDTLPAN